MRPSTTLAVLLLLAPACFAAAPPAELSRPEPVLSMRRTILEKSDYAELARRWKTYLDAFPSEEAAASWIAATRYARDESWTEKIDAQLERWPGNPSLLYLKAMAVYQAKDASGAAAALPLLEKALRLDPSAADPLFLLAILHLQAGDEAAFRADLEGLLAAGAMSDAVIDCSWNLLDSLEPGAVLLTNGDNDTYPAWALQRVHGHRTDVAIVNLSLLNTDWYAERLQESGVPVFADAEEVAALHAMAPPPWSDALALQLLAVARAQGLPVYFAATLALSDTLRSVFDAGRFAGLARRVDGGPVDLAALAAQWSGRWRTGGLDSWSQQHAPSSDAGRQLALNYASTLAEWLSGPDAPAGPARAALLDWHRVHVEPLLDAGPKAAVREAVGADRRP